MVKLYPLVCENLVEPIVKTVFVLFELANRSNPHLEACVIGSKVIISIATAAKLAPQFLNSVTTGKLQILLYLMNNWAGKHSLLVLNLCKILLVVFESAHADVSF